MSGEVKVFYVGNKPIKRDTVTGSKQVWRGHGDCRLIPEALAQRMFDFPDVWVNEKTFSVLKLGEAAERISVGPELRATGIGLSNGSVSGQPASDQPSRENQIIEAISQLDRTNKDHVTAQGMPKLEAVRTIMNDESVEKTELNAAWAAVKHLYLES